MAVSFFYFLVTTALISSAEYNYIKLSQDSAPNQLEIYPPNQGRPDNAQGSGSGSPQQYPSGSPPNPTYPNSGSGSGNPQQYPSGSPPNPTYPNSGSGAGSPQQYPSGSSTNQGRRGNSQGSGSGSPQQYPSDSSTNQGRPDNSQGSGSGSPQQYPPDYPVYQDQLVGSSSVPSYPDLSYPDDGSGCPPCVPSLPPAGTPITDEDIEVSVDSCITALNNLANNSKNQKYADLLKTASETLSNLEGQNYDENTRKSIGNSIKRMNRATRSAKKCRGSPLSTSAYNDYKNKFAKNMEKPGVNHSLTQTKVVLDTCSEFIENYCG